MTPGFSQIRGLGSGGTLSSWLTRIMGGWRWGLGEGETRTERLTRDGGGGGEGNRAESFINQSSSDRPHCLSQAYSV